MNQLSESALYQLAYANRDNPDGAFTAALAAVKDLPSSELRAEIAFLSETYALDLDQPEHNADLTRRLRENLAWYNRSRDSFPDDVLRNLAADFVEWLVLLVRATGEEWEEKQKAA